MTDKPKSEEDDLGWIELIKNIGVPRPLVGASGLEPTATDWALKRGPWSDPLPPQEPLEEES